MKTLAIRLLPLLALAACSTLGQEGDECESDADCAGDLECHMHEHDEDSGMEEDEEHEHGVCEEHEHEDE